MRTIEISTDVYSKIWALRHDGEETEDDVLRRLLITPHARDVAEDRRDAANNSSIVEKLSGFRDNRYGVTFLEGEEIFRMYKGSQYRARATKGFWYLQNDGSAYPSLHKLSWAVVKGHENAWNSWKVVRNGATQNISDLRPSDKIQIRIKLPEGFNLADLSQDDLNL